MGDEHDALVALSRKRRVHVAGARCPHVGSHRHLDVRVERGEFAELLATLDPYEHRRHSIVGAHVRLEVASELGGREVEREHDACCAGGARRNEIVVEHGVRETGTVPDLSAEVVTSGRQMEGLREQQVGGEGESREVAHDDLPAGGARGHPVLARQVNKRPGARGR